VSAQANREIRVFLLPSRIASIHSTVAGSVRCQIGLPMKQRLFLFENDRDIE